MRPTCTALAICAATGLPSAALAAGNGTDPGARVSLLGGWREADGSRLAAIVIRLAPGWHTYWRVPGDAGIPPSFDWTASTNLASVSYQWPRPETFESYGAMTIGYEDGLVLPVQVMPRDPQAPLDLSLSLFFGACADICVPAEAQASVHLLPDAPPDGRAEIEAALAERARTAAEAGVVSVSCTLAPAGSGYAVTARVTFAAAPGPGQVAVLESDAPELWIGGAETRTDGRTITASAPIAGPGATAPVLDRRDLRLTVLDARRAVDIPGCATPG